MSGSAAHVAAERTARASFGRLVALLAASTGDLQLAEDALSAAFEQALLTWTRSGVPDNPEGWLLTVARNRQRDAWKSAAHRMSAPLQEEDAGSESPFEDVDPDAIPDKRLELLFVCAHPAIDPAVRTPLMLSSVLGFRAAQIAAAFAVPEATMAQRLVRAKKRIKLAGIRFAVPGRAQLRERLPPVLEAVYGCYAIAWPDRAEATAPESLAGEAQYLAVTLAALLDDEPEAWGLAALITLSLARRPLDGGFVPLDEQDPRTWDADGIAEGEAYLRRAGSPAAPGRFQLEAAIQAVHCARARTGTTDWAALRTLYAALVTVAPTLGARVALATTVARFEGPEAGLSALPDRAEHFQPYWAARGDLLLAAGRRDEAAVAFERAAALTADDGARRYLERRRAEASRW
jgi:RNA polymerase sigma-70 factor (ECF subfamily)